MRTSQEAAARRHGPDPFGETESSRRIELGDACRAASAELVGQLAPGQRDPGDPRQRTPTAGFAEFLGASPGVGRGHITEGFVRTVAEDFLGEWITFHY